MKIAVLTMFNGLSKTYSLVNVVEEHLRMLLKAGMEVKLLVSEDCPDSDRTGIFRDERLQWVPVANRLNGEQIHWRDYAHPTGRVHPTFYEEAKVIAASLYEALADCDVCFMHDILYQGWHLVHNVAVRQVQVRLPRLRFLSMVHSLPAQRPVRTNWPLSARYIPMANTEYVYPTESGLPALASQYGVPLASCHAVNNSWSPLAEATEDVRRLAAMTDLMSPDLLVVYPGRLTPGKQFEKTAALAAAAASVSSRTVKVVFCDFPSQDILPHVYKRKIKEEAAVLGLKEEDAVFTSDLGWPDGFPHRGVMELFGLSNLFICPSYSESFGLIVLEAASQGNFIVLNEAVPALQELGGQLGAYFMRWNAAGFGVTTRESYHPSEREYLLDHAAAIVRLMDNDRSLRAKTIVRQRYSPDWIWTHQLKPLLMG